MSSGPDIQSDFKRLDKPSCQKILFQIEGIGVFGGIERGVFIATLLGGVHYNLFNDGEVQQFTNAANNNDLFKPIRSACHRLGPQALWAVYDTLLNTRNSPGAVQHGNIASKLQECVQSQARTNTMPTTTTYTDSTQGGTAEQDRGLPKTDQNQVTSELGYTAEDERYDRYRSASTTANTGGGRETLSSGDVPSMTSGRVTRDQSRTMVNTAPRLGDQVTGGNEQNESESELCRLDWNTKEFVAGFTDYLVDRMNREEYQALANEILEDQPSSDRKVIKKKIHDAVLQKNISLYNIGRFLLARQVLFVHIYKITEITNAPITGEVKGILKDHLGSLWEQLAYKMGMNRSTIHGFKAENGDNIAAQIDMFLNGKRQFPRLPNLQQTASLLVEIMEKASLPEVAKDIHREFLKKGLKEKDVYPGRADPYHPVDLQAVMQDDAESEELGSHPSGEVDVQQMPSSPPMTNQDKSPNAPENPTTQRDTSIPTENLPNTSESGQDKSLANGTQTVKHVSGSEVPQDQTKVQSTPSEPSRHPTKETATLEMMPPADNSSQQQQKLTHSFGTASGAGEDLNTCVTNNSKTDDKEAIGQSSQTKIIEVEVDIELDICEDGLMESDLRESIGSWIWDMSLVRRKDKKQIVHFAAELGYVQILEEVLLAGHNGRAVMERGQTPFLLACEAGKVDIVKLLYQKYGKCLLFERDELWRTCLHFPEVYRNKELFSFLIWDVNAPVKDTSKTGVTPLSVACLAGSNQEVNELLVQMSPPEKPRSSRMPPLHCAALSNNYAVLRYLIEQKYPYFSDPDSKSDDGYTPLHIAAARGNMDIVQYLVETAHCSVNETSADGSTALLLAAMCNHAEIAQYLISNRAQPGIDYSREIRKGLYHITPLGEAVLGRNVDVSLVLIQKGADILFKSGGTTSILDHACIGGNEQIVQMLISMLSESTQNETSKMDMFRSAFQVSVDFNDFKIAKLIVETVKRELDVSTVEEVFTSFKGKSESGLKYPLIKAINQYKQMIQVFPPEDLPNEGETCRRVAGGRSTVLYHIGYDDGPHWGTELMHISLLFEDLRKHERFRNAYKRVYMEATKCVVNNVINFNELSWESLASEAESSGNPSAVQFYSNSKLRSRYADPELFIHLGHAGVPSGINMACSMVSQNMIQDGFGMHGLAADQYFAEVIKRDKEHPGTFGLKYSCPGSEPAGGVRLRGGSTVQSGRQQSYPSRLQTAPKVTYSPPWKSQSGGYSSGTTSGGGGERQLTSPGGGGGQRQVGTPSDSGWQSQPLWDEAMSKGNTSSPSTQSSLGGEHQLESSGKSLEPLGGGGHQMNPPTDLHSSQNQSSLMTTGSLNPPSTSTTLPKSSTVTNATSSNTSTTTCTDDLTNTSPSLTAAHNTPPSTQHTGFGGQDPASNTEMPLQQFDNPADPQSIPREPESTSTGEKSHLTSRLGAGTGEVPNSVSPDKTSMSTFSEGTRTEYARENTSIPPPPSLPPTGQDVGKKPSGKIPLISPSPSQESKDHESFQSVQSAFKLNGEEDRQEQSNRIPPSYANKQQQIVKPTNPSRSTSVEMRRSKSDPSNLSAQVSNPIESDNGRFADHPAKQRDPQQIVSPDISMTAVQCTEEVVEAHFVMPSGKSVIMSHGGYHYPFDRNEWTLENSKPSEPNPDEGDSVELSTRPHSHTAGLIGGPPQDPVPNDPHGSNKGSELSTGNSPHHVSSRGIADASLPRSTLPVSSNPSVKSSPSAPMKNTLEKDSVTKFPSQSEVDVKNTFEHALLPEHPPSSLKNSLPGYGEHSVSGPQVRNLSSPRPSTYGGDEKFDKPIQLPQTTTTTTTTTSLSQQQQVSSTISNGTSPSQLSLKSNDSHKSNEDGFLSESPHTSEFASLKDDPGTTSADTMDQPSQPLVNASVDLDSRDHDHSSFHTRSKRSFDNTMDSEESGTSPTIHQRPVPVSNGSKPIQPKPTETGNSDTLPTTQAGFMEQVHPRSNTDEERENSIQAHLSLQPSVLQLKNKPGPSQTSLWSSEPHSSQTQWSMPQWRPPKLVHRPQRPPSSSAQVNSHPSQQSALVEGENDDDVGDDDDDARSIMSGSSIRTTVHTGNADLPLVPQQQQQQQVAQQQHQVAQQQQQHFMLVQSQEQQAWLNSPEQTQSQQQQKQQQEVWPQSPQQIQMYQQVQHQQHHVNPPPEQQAQEVKDSVSTYHRYPSFLQESQSRPEQDSLVDKSQLSSKELFSEDSEISASLHTVVNSSYVHHTMEGSREEEVTDSTEGCTSLNLQTAEGNQSDLDPSTPLVEDRTFTTVQTKFDMSINDTLEVPSQQQQQQKQQQQQQPVQHLQAEYTSQAYSYSSNKQDHFLPSSEQGHFLPSNEQGHFLPSNEQGHFLSSNEQGHFLPSNGQGHFMSSNGQGHFLPSNGQGHFLSSNGQGHILSSNGQGHFLPSHGQDHLLPSSGLMPSHDTSTLQDALYSLSSPNRPQLSGSHEGATFPSPPRPEMPAPTLTGISAPGMYQAATSMAHPLALTHPSWVTTPSMATHTDSYMQSVSTHLPQPAYPVERQQSTGPMSNTHLSATNTAFCSPLVRQQSSKDSGIVDYSSMENGSICGLRSQHSYQLTHQGSSLEEGLFQGTTENQPALTTQKSHPLHRQECVVGNGMHTPPRVDSTEYSGLPLKEAEQDDQDDQILRLVARQVNRKWTILARFAKVQEDEIAEIKEAHKNVGERSMTLLRELKKRVDWKELLIRLLRRMRMNLTADELQGCEAPPRSCVLLWNVDMVQHMGFLRDLTSSIGEHWKELALQLSVNWKERFDVIHNQPKENSCLEVIQMWLDSNTSPNTFRHLLMVVEATTVSCDVLNLSETLQSN